MFYNSSIAHCAHLPVCSHRESELQIICPLNHVITGTNLREGAGLKFYNRMQLLIYSEEKEQIISFTNQKLTFIKLRERASSKFYERRELV